MNCNICPRNCNADRNESVGYCGESNKIRISRADLHMWEEPCISGNNGSGAVFFTGCQLKCIFCQNHEIANNNKGKEISEDELVEIFFTLKEKGAHNINLVTPDHFLVAVRNAVIKAKEKGINIPFVYNCSGYMKREAVKALDGVIDIYLPDFKYFSSFKGMKYSNASDYPAIVKEAIEEMVLQKGSAEFDSVGMIKSGVIVRHLVLPGNISDSKKVLSYLYKTYGNRIYVSIMNQYTPVINHPKYPELNRKLTDEEYAEIIDFAVGIGMENAFCQEEGTAELKFIPEFGKW